MMPKGPHEGELVREYISEHYVDFLDTHQREPDHIEQRVLLIKATATLAAYRHAMLRHLLDVD